MDRTLASELGKELMRRAVGPVLRIGDPQLVEVPLPTVFLRLLR
jgi:hypothetical protein